MIIGKVAFLGSLYVIHALKQDGASMKTPLDSGPSSALGSSLPFLVMPGHESATAELAVGHVFGEAVSGNASGSLDSMPTWIRNDLGASPQSFHTVGICV